MPNRTLRADDSAAVLQEYADMVYRIAFSRTKNRADAEDVMQEVFLRYLRCKTAFNDETHRKNWLLRCAVNCNKSLISSAWFRRTTALTEDALPAQEPAQESIYPAVLALPQKYRTVIHLHYYEDMPIAEIAAVLQMKEATVKTRLHRARALLREALKGEFDDDMEQIETGN